MTQPSSRSSVDVRTTAIVVVVLLIGAIIAVVGLRTLGIGQHRPPVVLIGDSITANLDRTAKRRLGDDFSFTVDGKPGFLAAQQIEAARNASRFPFDQAVVNLGTNDVMDPNQDLAETIASLEQTVAALSRFRCVHVVTVSEDMINGDASSGARARRVNDAIRAMVDRYQNASVIDWAQIVHDNLGEGEPLTNDTVHPTDAGNRLLVDAYGDALAACET